MRETIDIPREELFEFKRRNGLIGTKMALYFGVAVPTMDGWLYRRACKMSRASYDMVMRKLAEGDISLPEEVLPPMDANFSSIASAIKGDTETCWVHYVYEVYPHNSAEEKEILIRYARVQEGTLRRWLNLAMPEGQNLLRLRCFLGHRGYGVLELEKLNGLVKALVYLIADWKMSLVEASDKLGYKQTGTLIQVLLGSVGMSDERLNMWRHLIMGYADTKTVQKETLTFACGDDVKTTQKETLPRDNVEVKRVEEVPVLVQFNHQELQSSIRRVNGTCRWEVESLAALVRAMLPLAERVLSDEYTEQDRERLRTLANEDGVFRLSNALNGLCGPRMRVRVMNKQEGE